MPLIKASIFVVISFSVVALMYSSLSAFYVSTFIVFAAPPDPKFGTSNCFIDYYYPGTVSKETMFMSCCWNEWWASGEVPFGTVEGSFESCQVCDVDESGDFVNCSEPEATSLAPPTPTPSPTAPENALPQGDVQQLPPTPPPTGGLFGSEGLPTPPAGLAPPTEPPAPTSEPTAPPATGQAEEDGSGGNDGIKPPVKDLLPDTGITEQPDVQQPEQEQPSGQGQGPAGPLT